MSTASHSSRRRFAPPPDSLLGLEQALRDAEHHVRAATARVRETGHVAEPDAAGSPSDRPRYGFAPVVASPPGSVHGGFVALSARRDADERGLIPHMYRAPMGE